MTEPTSVWPPNPGSKAVRWIVGLVWPALITLGAWAWQLNEDRVTARVQLSAVVEDVSTLSFKLEQLAGGRQVDIQAIQTSLSEINRRVARIEGLLDGTESRRRRR